MLNPFGHSKEIGRTQSAVIFEDAVILGSVPIRSSVKTKHSVVCTIKPA